MEFNLFPYIISVVSFIVIAFSFIPLASSLGLVDSPSDRKKHEGDIPILGGIGIFVSFCIGLFFTNINFIDHQYIFLTLFIITIIGVFDDIWDLSARVKLLFHILAISIFLKQPYLISSLGGIFGPIDIALLPLTYLFTVFAIIGAMNAVNMSDGVDGLASLNSLIVFLIISVISFNSDKEFIFVISSVFASSTLAFLLFNLKILGEKNKIFLGDSGTTQIGFVICLLLILLSQGDNPSIRPVTALWIMALPLIDTIAIILRRIRKKRSPFSADREHLHHFFMSLGFSDRKTLFTVTLLSIALISIGLLMEINDVSSPVSFISFVIVFSIYSYLLSHSWKLLKVLKG